LSIVFTLAATDGVVLVADGRTTSVPTEKDPDPAPKTDVAVKMTLVPYGLPIAVTYTGRGGIGGTPLSGLVDRFLDLFPKAELADLPFGDIIAKLRAHLDDLAAQVPAMYGDKASEPVHVLVAGYRPGSEELEVWKSVGPEPAQVSRECLDLVFCGLRDDRPDGEPAEDRVLVLFEDEYRIRQDHIDEYRIDGDYYLLRGKTMAEVVESAVASLRADVDVDPDTYTGDGIGGVWRLASVSPTGATNVDCFHIGPMLAGDAGASGAPCGES
jgi:hypothetical protein